MNEQKHRAGFPNTGNEPGNNSPFNHRTIYAVTWQIRQISGVEERDAWGRVWLSPEKRSIIGTSGTVIKQGLALDEASALKQELAECWPDNIYTIEQER